MEYTGTTLVNSFYLGSPAGIFKVSELVFGAGAWGPLAIDLFGRAGSSPNAFTLWATLSSWVLILASFLLGLLERVKIPKTEADIRDYEAPRLGDLAINAVIAIVYIPAIVVFGVFNIGANQPPTLWPTFVLVMQTFTFLIHAANASSLITFINIQRQGWGTKGKWIWRGNSTTRAPARQQQQTEVTGHPANQNPHKQMPTVTYMNPPVSPEEVAVHQESEIYQDI